MAKETEPSARIPTLLSLSLAAQSRCVRPARIQATENALEQTQARHATMPMDHVCCSSRTRQRLHRLPKAHHQTQSILLRAMELERCRGLFTCQSKHLVKTATGQFLVVWV